LAEGGQVLHVEMEAERLGIEVDGALELARRNYRYDGSNSSGFGH